MYISDPATSSKHCTNGLFYQKPNDSWWFHVTGKGRKDREIPVSDEMLTALARYRRSRGLSPFPSRGEHEPLLTVSRTRMTEDGDIDDDQALRSERAVREVVQKCFDASYKTMSKDKSLGKNATTDAESLREATVHWLRHTGISVDIKQRDPHHVRIDAGHSKFETTSNYIQDEEEERHRSAIDKKLNPST